MQIVPALNKIMGILDQEDPTKYLSSLLSLLGNMEKSAAEASLAEEISVSAAEAAETQKQ